MKKILAMVLVVALCVCLMAGCGSTAPSAPSAPANTESNAPANNDAPATQPADGVQVFKLGSIGPLTGGAAIYGQAVINGAKIAVDEINAMGGNIQFEFQGQDDEADAEKSVNAYNKLMDWGMQVMVGPTTTGASIATGAQAAADRTIMITPSASGTDVIANGDNVFQVCFTDPNQGIASADYMAANFADASIAVIYRNDDAYSQLIRDTFVAQAAANGLNVVYEGTFTEDTSTDFSVQLTAAQSAGADLVFLPIYYQPASIILNQANQMGYAPVFFGVDGMDGILAMEGFDASLAEGVFLLTPFSADAADERTQNFVNTYKAQFGEIPNQFAADAYDGVYIMMAALEAAGCTADMDAVTICDMLVPVMTQISVDGLTGLGMTWAATGEVSKAPMAVVIENGTYVLP